MRYNEEIRIADRWVGQSLPTYFVADVASNHDGDLARARELIWRARDAGADAVKFQHFRASKIVSDYGFRRLGNARSHQAGWPKSVYATYRQYELNREWTHELIAVAREADISLFTTPYDLDAIALMAPLTPAFKIGSGDIDWLAMICEASRQGKPVLLAIGASELKDVTRAVEAILAENRDLVLMQCNTNYTGSPDNFRFVNLRVLNTLAARWPGMPLGLSDHTPGHATVLGAVALGARVIEKHFTDDNTRSGPDHSFAMDPASWAEMMQRTRELEQALGDGIKRIEENELDAVIVQRRCVRLSRDMAPGVPLSRSDLECLRPAEPESLAPSCLESLVGLCLTHPMKLGEAIHYGDLAGTC
jgi:sialic acid synthase SpsE